MKIKNLNIRSKALVLLGLTSVTLSLTGCSSVDNRYTYDKALVFNDKCVTIVDINRWVDYGGDRFQIKTPSGIEYLTNNLETKLIDTRESSLTLEEFIYQIYGNDIEIRYFSDGKVK